MITPPPRPLQARTGLLHGHPFRNPLRAPKGAPRKGSAKVNTSGTSASPLAKAREGLRQWLVDYYTGDVPTLSGVERAALAEEVRRLEGEGKPPQRDWISPDVRVTPPLLDPFPEREHAHPMLSLSNVYDMDELREWEATLLRVLPGAQPAYLAELKVDGVAISLLYEQGVLTAAVTRGDGRKGEEVTRNLKTVRGLPHRLPEPLDLEVRGEVYFRIENFEHMNRQRERMGEAPFKNPRNAAAGSLRTLDTSEVGQRGLDVAVYALAGASPRERDSETLAWLATLGFPVSSPLQTFETLDELEAYYEEIRLERGNLGFHIDGLVVKVDQLALREAAGATSKSPRWAVALKFGAEQVETTLESVTVGVGRTGVLTPIAHLTPVELGGTTVAKATLHNYEQIERLGLRTGLRVLLEKGGDIIPKVVALATGQEGSGEEIKRPEHCPECGMPAARLEGEVDDYCVNPACPAQRFERIRHFVSRGAMDIESMGRVLIEQLLAGEHIETVADLFALEASTLAGLERMAEKSAANVMQSIEASRTRTLDRFLFGLGIRYVGERTARVLARHFGALEALREADEEALADINEIGAVTAKSIVAFFADSEQARVIDQCLERGVAPQPLDLGAAVGALPLGGKTVVITGTLAAPRRQWKDRLERAGAMVTGSVSKKTDFLLAGENPGSKLEAARVHGVTILDEAGMNQLLENS